MRNEQAPIILPRVKQMFGCFKIVRGCFQPIAVCCSLVMLQYKACPRLSQGFYWTKNIRAAKAKKKNCAEATTFGSANGSPFLL